MRIFNFLRINNSSTKTSKPLDSIDGLFQFDFENFDINDFESIPFISTQTIGVQSHLKFRLYPKERGLFDLLEIKEFSSGTIKNFTFVNLKPKRRDISKVKRLVNDLVSILGNDSTKAGEFKSDDSLDLKSDYWTGRSWMENKFNTPLTLAYESSKGITLVISKRIVS